LNCVPSIRVFREWLNARRQNVTQLREGGTWHNPG